MEENCNNTGEQTPGTTPERTFTQAEVDALIGRRLAKAMKGMPDTEELTAFRNWQKERGESENALAALTRERDEARELLEQARREKFLMQRGMTAEEAEFLAFKISRGLAEGQSFSEAAEGFLKENRTSRVRVELGARMGGGRTTTVHEEMNELLRGNRKGGF